MTKNKIKHIIQDYQKESLTNSINLLGMAIGLAVVILIGWWTVMEFSFDRFHEDYKEIYLVKTEGVYNEKRDVDISVPPSFSTEVPGMYPNIKACATVFNDGDKILEIDNKQFYQNGIGMVSNNFFTFFHFPLLYGDPKTCLDDPNNIVIDEVLALKLFGTKNAVGKRIRFQGNTFHVSAVMKEMPVNSSIRLHLVGSTDYVYKLYPWARTTWSGFDRFYTFYKFTPNTNREELANSITQKIYEKEPDDKKYQVKASFQPIEEMHLYGPSEQYRQLFAIMGVAAIIFIISCLNFSNLFMFTALSQQKSIAIRRIHGASTFSIIKLLYQKSLFYVFISCVVGVFISIWMTTTFNELMSTNLYFDFANPILWGFLLIVIVVVSTLCILYPVWQILHGNEVDRLRGQSTTIGNKKVQKIFLVLQFTVSIALLSFVILVQKQFDYLDKRENGLKKENVLIFHAQGEISNKYELFSHLVNPKNSNTRICYSTASPASWNDGVMVSPLNKPEEEIHTEYVWTSKNYFDFFDIHVVGDCFKNTGTANELVVLNSTAVKRLHLVDPIGKKLKINDKTVIISGVTKGVHRDPYQTEDYPIVYRHIPEKNINTYDYIMVRTKDEKKASIQWVEKQWQEINPNIPFRYQFISEAFKSKYSHLNNLTKLINTLMVIALIISLIGMFAIANFTIQSRTKEFAIRRVNGASTEKIFVSQVIDFMIPIFGSYLLSIPLFLYFGELFLSLFAFKVSIGVANYLIPFIAVLIVSFIAVLFQCIKASRTNPIEVLRHE
ncbi:ABC transporter permease [Halosquirtibacter laminarini]|uniref:ABC transporter permease n=1 Tax=Halosquirtibacter laminarini TaxID=3374600 RepID=A0AC61NMU6_9BACT|nr:ABC transporter permease [Prolixibacteraceae bacterium]